MSDYDELLARLDGGGHRATKTEAAAVIRELESDLASERVKRGEAERSAVFAGKEWAEWQQRAVAAEATIEKVRRLRAEAKFTEMNSHDAGYVYSSSGVEDMLDDLDTILANADTSALARHDSEAAARALEDLADYLSTLNNSDMIVNLFRALAAEKRAEQ